MDGASIAALVTAGLTLIAGLFNWLASKNTKSLNDTNRTNAETTKQLADSVGATLKEQQRTIRDLLTRL